jgi:alpha-mannosidase
LDEARDVPHPLDLFPKTPAVPIVPPLKEPFALAIDPVWLWRWQDGFAEIKATFRAALDCMNEFPDFIFTSVCACYYKWVEQNAPEMFEEIKKLISEGGFAIAGGLWIQRACNIPSGESFCRHALYSQRYFHEKFGHVAQVGYNVDCFGHNGMLPQIHLKSGMDAYVFMRPDGREKGIAASPFCWRSPAFRIQISYGDWTGNFFEGSMTPSGRRWGREHERRRSISTGWQGCPPWFVLFLP